ncbi:MAG: class I SAM-dependent methyltransferase [Bacillota bacterium]
MDHYFTNKKVKSNIKTHKIVIRNKSFKFLTDHGVFSKQGLDYGSRQLIETLLENEYSKLLDLGCGYGPIGIILKYFNNKADIQMVDINERAINLARENAKINNVSVKIFKSDGFLNVKDKFDTIVTNPPIRAGKKVIYRFFENAIDYLNDNGKLYIVINKKHGANSAFKKCQEIYSQVEMIKKKSGFIVIRCGK